MALKGINYGHHLLATAYNPQTVVSELQMLYNNGYRLLRVAYPTYNSSSGTLNMLKDVVVKGLDCGFTVIWGVVGNRPTITSTNYSTFASYVTGTLAPWAQALNNPKLRLSIGNEEELHVDGTTMTIATLQSNLKSLATSVQSVYTVGEVNYVTDAEQWTLWNTLGLGDIDKIGFNLYYEWQPTGSYATKLAAINTAFTTRYFIGEYSTSNGFADASAFGAATAEDNWAQNIAQRRTIADSYNIDHCVFCFGDGQFGVTANSWALRKTDGTFRKAWYAHSGSRAYGTKTVSPAGAITISAPSGVNTGDQTLAIAGTSLTISGANGNSVTLPTPSGGTWGSITGTLSSQTDLQTALSAKAASSSLSTVATSGSYTDLINKPTIPTVSDASTTVKGIVQLAGDLAGSATAPTVPGLATKLTGPGTSVSGNIATFNGTTGLAVADSGVSASALSTSITTLGTSKEPTITAGTSGQYWDGTKTWQTLNKAAVGLASVNDTSDASKPVSTAQQTALDAKVAKGDLVFNVKDYGATGNGTTDDTTAVQAAITAAITAGGGSILLPVGDYATNATLVIDPLSLTRPLRISGYGAKLIYSGSSDAIRLDTNIATSDVQHAEKSVTLEGLYITGTSSATSAIRNKGCCLTSFNHLVIEGFTSTTDGNAAFVLESRFHFWIEENHFDTIDIKNTGHGFCFYSTDAVSGSSASIMNNKFTNIHIWLTQTGGQGFYGKVGTGVSAVNFARNVLEVIVVHPVNAASTIAYNFILLYSEGTVLISPSIDIFGTATSSIGFNYGYAEILTIIGPTAYPSASLTTWYAGGGGFNIIGGNLGSTFKADTAGGITAPTLRLGSAIKDTNGNTLLGQTAIASAVNYLTLQNAATGGGIWMYPTGTDTNIDMTLSAKGSGAVKLSNGSPIATASDLTAKASLSGATFTGAITASAGITGPSSWTIWGHVNELNASSGTSTAPVAGSIYWISIYVGMNCTLTGVTYTLGASSGVGNVIGALYSGSGALLANTATAGTAVGSSNTKQKVPFTSTIAVTGPGMYFLALQFSAITPRFLTLSNTNESFVTGSTTGTFGTLPTITPGTTYTVNLGPWAATY